MFNLTNNVIVILLITTLINSFTTYVSWQRRKTKGGLYIVLAMLGIAFWTLSVGLDYATVPIPLKVFFAEIGIHILQQYHRFPCNVCVDLCRL